MISYMTGQVAAKTGGSVILEVNGIGYELAVSTTTLDLLPAVGQQVSLFTHLQVKEDGLTLYGFSDQTERDMFLCLIGVSGIGPKIGLAALSALRPRDLARAIADSDVARISTVPGVGKKTAQRIVLELQGSLALQEDTAAAGTSPTSPAHMQALAALTGMGFTSDEATAALEGCEKTDVSSMVRYALKNMGGRS